jgi:oligopeptide transport system ATP-binding protein
VTTPLIDVRNLTTTFGRGASAVRAVEDVSFDVKPGETVAIVGESGSGKSATALSILRLLPSPPGRIASGEVVFEGRDLTLLSESEMRHIRGNRISMIFQEPMTSLNPSLTVGLQIAEPIIQHLGLSWAESYRKAEELLARVRVPDARQRLAAYPHQFSGGMRQRIMIAIALACQPRLIIADEPTTALDVTVQAQILELLKDVTRESGASLILITHDLGVVARYADRVNVMYGGRIVESSTTRALFASPLHPYTRGLMTSIPRLDQPAGTRLVPILGQPPDLSRLPAGCSFAPRCGEAIERCRAEGPLLAEAAPGHSHACWNAPHAH